MYDDLHSPSGKGNSWGTGNKLTNGVNLLWPNQVLSGNIEEKDLLDKFSQTIFESVDFSSNRFSEFDPLIEGPEICQEFKNKVVVPCFEKYLNNMGLNLQSFGNYRLKSWITGSKEGYSISAHNHSGASLSAVFYLLVGNRVTGGDLVIIDPRTNANRGYLDAFKPFFENKVFTPQSGEYIIIPGYLYHHTTTFYGSLRLAMPVDLFLS
jgi:hypothetical protein